jgi:dimethylhistidine N-methyltransferase
MERRRIALGPVSQSPRRFPANLDREPQQAGGAMPTRTLKQRTRAQQREQFRQDVLDGLSRPQKELPCKYFYDRRGSQLFDEICELDEYYLTRTELAIMQQYAAEMGEQIGPGVMLVEYGSGSSVKTRILLDNLPQPAAYVPVDISDEHLDSTAQSIARDYPQLEVLPVCADFTEDFDLPAATVDVTHAAVYFPGSTIGNLRPHKARHLLERIAPLCGTGGGLLIGIDLQKDPDVIEAAYNDRRGVTAEFNLNLLHRINRELAADFDVDQFQHLAFYNSELGRIETYAVSRCDQTVTIGKRRFRFRRGERIHTENSHKYTIEDFAALAAEAGLTLRRHWTDGQRYFAVLHFAVLADGCGPEQAERSSGKVKQDGRFTQFPRRSSARLGPTNDWVRRTV